MRVSDTIVSKSLGIQNKYQESICSICQDMSRVPFHGEIILIPVGFLAGIAPSAVRIHMPYLAKGADNLRLLLCVLRQMRQDFVHISAVFQLPIGEGSCVCTDDILLP
jgi:hypothetical protein